MSQIPQETPAGRLPAPEDRLESWKEIAAYLKRGVRTVQRWERDEGLPIHRHEHTKRATPYAFKGELEAWRSRHDLTNGSGDGGPSPSPWLWRAVLMTVVVVVSAVGGFWLYSPPHVDLEFQKEGWVLITTFENRTGEQLLTGTLEAALERELSNSRYAYVVQRPRIDQILQLMRRPVDTRVDASLGREIALRDGDIGALITGSVDQLGSSYLLTAKIHDPTSGGVLSSHEVEAEDEAHVLPAVRRLSSMVREALGEALSSIGESERRLERVTTPSLRALRLFSEAYRLGGREQWAAAEQLAREAVAEDPDFAAAHDWIAWAVLRRSREAPRPHLTRAMELADTTSDRERFFIMGHYYSFMGEIERSIAAYEALVELHPDHYWGARNLSRLYLIEGRFQEAARLKMRQANLQPSDIDSNWDAASTAAAAGNLAAARHYVDRVNQLIPPDSLDHAFVRSWAALFPAHEHWVKGDVKQAVDYTNRLVETFAPATPLERAMFGCEAGKVYLALGKLDAAETSFRHYAPNLPRMNDSLCVPGVALARRDWDGLTTRMLGVLAGADRTLSDGWRGFTAWLLTRGGPTTVAQEFVRGLEPRSALAEAYLAVAQGHGSKAIGTLQQTPNLFSATGAFAQLRALADALVQQGDLREAIDILENPPLKQEQMYYEGGSTGASWIELRWHLSELYRMADRPADAERVEAELIDLLAYADDDHPVLLELRRVRASAVSLASRAES